MTKSTKNGKVAASPAPPASVTKAAGGKRVGPSQRAGTAGYNIQGGYIVSGEKNPALSGDRKFKTYAELISNVSIVAAATRRILGLIGKAKWTVEPAEDGGPMADRIAEQVEAALFDHLARPWHRVVRRSFSFQLYGFAVQEWITKRLPDGSIGFFDIEPRPSSTIKRWDVDDEGATIKGFFQESAITGREHYIQRSKAVYLTDDALTDSPEGLGILRHVAPDAKRLQAYERLEGVGFETDLRGIPVGRAPYTMLEQAVADDSMTQAEAREATSVIESFVKDHVKSTVTGLVLDSMVHRSLDEGSTPSSSPLWGMDLLKAGNNSQAEVAAAIDRLTFSIAFLFGAEGMLLGKGGTGSLALSRDKSTSLGLVVDGSLTEIAETYQKDLVETLGRLNGWRPEDLPRLKTEKLQHRDVTEITDALEGMARSGAVLAPDDPAIDSVREILGLPLQETMNLDLDAGLRGGGLREDDSVQDTPTDGAGASVGAAPTETTTNDTNQ